MTKTTPVSVWLSQPTGTTASRPKHLLKLHPSDLQQTSGHSWLLNRLPAGRATSIINQFSFKPILHWCDLFQEWDEFNSNEHKGKLQQSTALKLGSCERGRLREFGTESPARDAARTRRRAHGVCVWERWGGQSSPGGR